MVRALPLRTETATVSTQPTLRSSPSRATNDIEGGDAEGDAETVAVAASKHHGDTTSPGPTRGAQMRWKR
ncbi:hypothetical protein M0804_003499 [Polistes exclamans]|nr:hypothetical protein M0804_003499 [Polistes exclamans]